MIKEKMAALDSLIKDSDDKGCVIVINGPWGVGKTEFWKKFIKEYYEDEKTKTFYRNKPYGYVSLFGVDTLQSLKIQISTSLASKHTLSFMSIASKMFNHMKDIRIGVGGANITAPKIFEELLFNQIKNCIICIDDFERKSSKLEVKEILGLINYLKIENNCKVVLIMHDGFSLSDDKKISVDDDKKIIAEYKEKIFDDFLVINSVKYLLDGFECIDEKHKEIYLRFYHDFNVQNFRFYLKVDRLHKRFIRFFSIDALDALSCLILRIIFEGVFIVDFPNSGYSWYIERKNSPKKEEYPYDVFEMNRKFGMFFFRDEEYGDEWFYLIKKWLLGEEISHENLSCLVDQNKSRQKNKACLAIFERYLFDFNNFNIDGGFPEKFFTAALSVESNYDLSSVDYFCYMLEVLGRQDLAIKLQKEVEKNILKKYEGRSRYTFGLNEVTNNLGESNRFFGFIDSLNKKEEDVNILSLYDVLRLWVGGIAGGSSSISLASVIDFSQKQDWENVIFNNPVLGRREEVEKLKVIEIIFNNIKYFNNYDQVKRWIIEILHDKFPDGGDYVEYRKFMMSRLKLED